MPRLPLRDLEEALRNPVEYRRKLQQPVENSYGPTYFGALRDAISTFHKTNGNLMQAKAYLVARLARFVDTMRCAEIVEQFEWYTEEYISRGWLTFETRLRVVIQLPPRASAHLFCSGEVNRVDIVPTGGYAAWLMRSRGPEDWVSELRMPLVQGAIAQKILQAPAGEVRVGIYSFKERFVDLCCYSQNEVDQAYADLDDLLRRMGF
jgi:hypothetical protein